MGEVVSSALWTVLCIPMALTDWFYFKEKKEAKRSLAAWLCGLIAVGISFLFNYVV